MEWRGWACHINYRIILLRSATSLSRYVSSSRPSQDTTHEADQQTGTNAGLNDRLIHCLEAHRSPRGDRDAAAGPRIVKMV